MRKMATTRQRSGLSAPPSHQLGQIKSTIPDPRGCRCDGGRGHTGGVEVDLEGGTGMGQTDGHGEGRVATGEAVLGPPETGRRSQAWM